MSIRLKRGTLAQLNAAAAGSTMLSGSLYFDTTGGRPVVATSSNVFKGIVLDDDARLTNARTPTAHTHPWSEVTGKPTEFAPSAHSHAWAEITGKPTTFAPSAHSQAWSTITGTPITIAGYGIGDAYTKTEVDGLLSPKATTAYVDAQISNLLGGAPAAALDTIAELAAALTDNDSDIAAITTSLAGKQPLASVLTNTTASFTTALLNKLNGIAAGATANSSDATLLAIANHTGTISDAQHGNRGGGALHAAVVAGGASGFMTGADKTKLDAVGTMANRAVTISTAAPSGGANGDVWFQI